MDEDQKRKGLIFSGMGIELVVLILGGAKIGSIIDSTYELNGLGQAGMIILVMAAWFYHLVIMLQKFMKDNNSESESD